jgi:hypothetical protein
MCRAFLLLIVLLACGESANGEGFQIKDVPSSMILDARELAAKTIAFSDNTTTVAADAKNGLTRFEDWASAKPVQKRFLSLFPSYVEPTINVTVQGMTKPYKNKLHLYIAEARFLIDRPAKAIDLTRYANLAFLESIDPEIKHQTIKAEDVLTAKDPHRSHNQNPERPWCDQAQAICIQSRYQFEGKIPVAIRLVNKLREGSKKIAEYIEIQSELRALHPAQLDQTGLKELTGFESPVTGVLEQNIFHVNQIMQFGKLLAILQDHPTDTNKAVVSAFLALGIETHVLELKKEYESYPVLHNLVPSQVLLGKSSFNTGTSISAGLPSYTRNRIKAIAGILEQG